MKWIERQPTIITLLRQFFAKHAIISNKKTGKWSEQGLTYGSKQNLLGI